MHELPMSQSGGLVKLPRVNHTRIRVRALKPPEQVQIGERVESRLRYVSPQHKEIKAACTPEVFTRVLGKRSKRRAHTGLDMHIYHRFVLVVDRNTNLVCGVDMYPFRQNMHGLARADDPAHKNLVMSINSATGDMVVEDYPSEVSEGSILSLLDHIDKQGTLDVGDEWGGFEVSAIAGGKVFFNIDNLDDASEQMDEDAIFSTSKSAASSSGITNGTAIV